MSWVAVALSDDIEVGTSSGVLLDGRELVLWRDSHGNAHVWDDRCPHRGMRMSFGFVRGDRIACLYHGWQYDTAGQCRTIPAHPDLDVPATIRVTTHPTIEVAGMVWTSIGGDPGAFPVLPEGGLVSVRSVSIDRPLDVVARAFSASDVPTIGDAAMTPAFIPIADGVWSVASGSDRLLIAGQTIDATQSALHICLQATPRTDPLNAQVHFACWAVALRDTLEAGEAGS